MGSLTGKDGQDSNGGLQCTTGDWQRSRQIVSSQEQGELCKRKSKTGHGVGAKAVSKAELSSSCWLAAEMSNIYCLAVRLLLRATLKGLVQPSTGSL